MICNAMLQVKLILAIITTLDVLHVGSALECFKCNSTTLYGDRGCSDYPHYYNVMRETCPINTPHVCSVYKYDVTLYGATTTTTTIRGCQPLAMVRDCLQMFAEAQNIVRPAIVHERLCYSCRYDLCNSSFMHNSSGLFYLIIIIHLLIV